jgi:hypothetical protein
MIGNEFDIEFAYLAGVGAILFSSLFLIIKGTPPGTFTVLLSLVTIAVIFFNLYVLAMMLFGYGFTGTTVPLIWKLTLVCNLALLASNGYYVIQAARKKA